MNKILYIDEWSGINPLDISGNGLGSSLFKLAAMADSFDAGYEVDLLTSSSKKELLKNAYSLNKIYTCSNSLSYSEYDKIIFMGILESLILEKPIFEYYAFSNEHKKLYKNTPHTAFWRKYNQRHTTSKDPCPEDMALSVGPPKRGPQV